MADRYFSKEKMAPFYVTRLAIRVVFLFVSFIYATGTGVFNDNSRQPLSESGFMGSCREVLDDMECDNLWNSFTENFRCPRDNCAKDIDDDNYYNFIAEQPPKTNENEAMFYSGQTFERASSYTRCNNKKIIENTTLGHIFNGFEWCCVQDTEVIPSCDKKCQTTKRFWELLSEKFAENAWGDTTAVLNGSSSSKPFIKDSVFGKHEVGKLNGSKVKKMLVLLVYKKNVVSWRCNSPNSDLDILQNKLDEEGIGYQCEEEEMKEFKVNNYLVDCSDAATPQSLRFPAILLSTMLVMLVNS